MKYDEEDAPVGRSIFTDPEMRAARLVREGALEAARDAVAARGHAEDAEALYREARGRVEYLERCLAEAQAVLGGDLGASTRLWLLLREPVAGADIPASAVEEAAAGARAEPPRLMDGDSLLRLVAGVVRAANRPDEADRMLDSLGRLLQPLFLLDFAATAAGDSPPGQGGALKTLLFARRAPQWREALAASHAAGPNRPPAPDPLTPGPPGDGTTPFNPDRDKFDHDSWLVDASDVTKGISVSAWPCFGEARKAMSMRDILGSRYRIDSLSDPSACPGQRITIRGSGFGPQGRVAFPPPDPSDPAFQLGVGPGHPILAGVEPVRWTDTEIDVVVPPWATSGELRLNAFQTRSNPCMDVDVYRLGNTIAFRGGLARVYRVFINSAEVDLDGRKLPNIDPLDVTTLSWHASSGPNVRIRAELLLGTRTLWSQDNLPGGFGSTLVNASPANRLDPAPHSPTDAVLVLTARGPCGATQPLRVPVFLSVRPRLAVEYVEVTQGVQGDRGEVETGRGMPLVAAKDTAVRVHLSCDRRGWYFNKAENITGSLRVDNHPPLVPTNVRPLVPDRRFITFDRLSRPEFTNETLNFLIPAAWLTPGQHTVAVRVVYQDRGGREEAGQAVRPTWHFKLPMRVRCLYLGRRTNYRAEDLLQYAREALDLIPTPLTDIGVVGRMWHTRDSEDEDFWEDLCDDVQDAWDDADQPEGLRWLGIFPASEYKGGTTKGIAPTPGNVALSIGDSYVAAAHELGHSSGLRHVNLPPGAAKGPYDWADSGGLHRRPPFDVRRGLVWSLPAGDLMSYQQPNWPGVTTWVRLFNKVF